MRDYVLDRKIATGGMAEVFLAYDLSRKPVVIKKILPHLASQTEYLRMFREELQILSSLQHENIVRVLEAHTNYVVMEYLEGYDWRTISQHFVPQSIVNYLFLEALSGLSYVHNSKIVHRDISPQNWMLTYSGKVKLLDFGISKYEERSAETITGVLKGKYSYMSPEQASGGKISIHSDIFSMGVILFELSTRTRLFKRSSDMLTLQAIAQCEVQIPENMDPELGQIILRALAKQKENRFQSCEQFREALFEYAQKKNQMAESKEVADFMRNLPRPRNQILTEATQIKAHKNNFLAAAFGALVFAFSGLGFEQQQFAPVQKVALGRLKIFATPWARVYINGDYVGATPMATKTLPEGTYQVDLENPEISKHVSRAVIIKSDQDTLLRQNW
ncbi:MAG: serine/threonine-protein kinase [Myxococcaceae bacterium]